MTEQRRTRFLLGQAGRLRGGGVAGVGSGKMSDNFFFKSRGRVMQWALLVFKAPDQAWHWPCPSAGPEQGQEDEKELWLVEDLGCYFHDIHLLWVDSF